MAKEVDVYLTPTQIKKYNETGKLKLTKNCLKSPNYKILVDSKKFNDLKQNKIDSFTFEIKHGGVIPLIPIVAGIAGTVSAISSVYNSYNNKKTNERLVREKERQNNILEKQNQEGKPITVNTLQVEGQRLINGSAITQKRDVTRRGANINSVVYGGGIGQKVLSMIKNSKL